MTAIKPTRREQRKQVYADRIMAAGRMLYSSCGIENTTIEKLCDEAGISRRTFYTYFPTKNDLTEAIFVEMFYRPLDRIFAGVRATSDDTQTRLRLIIEGFAQAMDGQTREQHALAKELVQTGSPHSVRGPADRTYLRAPIKAIVDEGLAKGDIRPDFSADILVEVIAGTCDSISINWWFDYNYPANQRLKELAHYVCATLN